MFTNFLKKATNRQLQSQIQRQLQKVNGSQTDRLVGQVQDQNNQQEVKQGKQMESQKNQLVKELTDSIPPFTKSILEDIDNDRVSYTDRIQQNMHRRLHIRNHLPQKTQADLNQYFLKRMNYLNSIYPFFQSYFFQLTDDKRHDDDELVYDIEKINVKEYIKKLVLQPGSVPEPDVFPRYFISAYLFVLINWFLIDVVIFKLVYGEEEILGIDKSKKYIKSQLKGQEYKMELKENKTSFPVHESKQEQQLKNILKEINSIQNTQKPSSNLDSQLSQSN